MSIGACTMPQGAGGEFGDDQFSEFCILAERPAGECLTDYFASVSEFGWVVGQPPGHAGLACQGWGPDGWSGCAAGR